MTHRSLEGLPQDTRGGFDLYSAQVSFAFGLPRRRFWGSSRDEKRAPLKTPAWEATFAWLRVGFGYFGLYLSSLPKSAGFVSLAGKASLVSTFGAVRISWKKLCWKGSDFD